MFVQHLCPCACVVCQWHAKISCLPKLRPLPAVVVQNEVAQKERMESMWKAEQERRTKAGEDFQTDQKSRAAVEKVITG